MDSILSFSQLAFRLPKTSAGKMDSILSFWNLEQLSQAIPQFLALPAYHTLLHPAFAPPLDPSGINRVWGAGLLICPSPALWELQGMGHQEVEGNLQWISRRYGRKAHQKARLDLSLATVHSICVTVRLPPHFCHSGRGFHGCRTEVGGLRRSSAHCIRGVPRANRPQPKS